MDQCGRPDLDKKMLRLKLQKAASLVSHTILFPFGLLDTRFILQPVHTYTIIFMHMAQLLRLSAAKQLEPFKQPPGAERVAGC